MVRPAATVETSCGISPFARSWGQVVTLTCSANSASPKSLRLATSCVTAGASAGTGAAPLPRAALPAPPSARAAWRAERTAVRTADCRSEEHTSELQSRGHLVCRLLLEKKQRGDEQLRSEVDESRGEVVVAVR